VESWIEGISGTTFKWRAGWKRTVGESALHFLIYLHRSTSKPTQIHRELFDALLQEQVAGVEEMVRGFEPGFDLRPLVEALWNVFGGRQMPLVRTHGDFGLANILVSNEGQLVGVLDWDASMEQGWLVLDLLNLIACQRKWRAIWLFGNMVTRTLMQGRLAAWEREMVARYCGALSIVHSLWPGFIALYWLGRVSWLRHAFGEKWLRQNVVKPLPRILEELGRVPGYCHNWAKRRGCHRRDSRGFPGSPPDCPEFWLHRNGPDVRGGLHLSAVYILVQLLRRGRCWRLLICHRLYRFLRGLR
jgi:hypothetical protein